MRSGPPVQPSDALVVELQREDEGVVDRDAPADRAELAELMETPPAGISVQLADESDVYKWKVFMKGPEGTPYQVFSSSPLRKKQSSVY